MTTMTIKPITIAMTALTIYTSAFPGFENTLSFGKGNAVNEFVQENIQDIIDGKTTNFEPKDVYPLNSIDQTAFIQFLEHPQSKTMEHISLILKNENNGFLVKFGAQLNTLPNLVQLDINSRENFNPILDALESNTTIQSVLFRTTLDSPSLLCALLEKNSTLRTLMIGLVPLTNPQDTQLFADALERNTSLYHLNMGDQSSDIPCIKTILKALEKNTCLKSFCLASMRLDRTEPSMEIIEALCETIKKNQTLRSIEILGQYISEEQANMIAEALKHNHTIERVGSFEQFHPAIQKRLQRNKQFNQMKDQQDLRFVGHRLDEKPQTEGDVSIYFENSNQE